VTTRESQDELFRGLHGGEDTLRYPRLRSVTKIGDCFAPSIVAEAVHSGHAYARQLDTQVGDRMPYGVEHTALGPPVALGPFA
jgi:dimethylamine/trimethylamine dehydrogenase